MGPGLDQSWLSSAAWSNRHLLPLLPRPGGRARSATVPRRT